MWKKVMLLVIGVVSIIFVANNLFAQQKNLNDLSGKKWGGEREINEPRRMLIKTTVEITKSIDGKIEGFYHEKAEGYDARDYKFSTTVEGSPSGLPRFRFKNPTGTMENQCDVHGDGRLSLQLFMSG